jgi:hypothetical protein
MSRILLAIIVFCTMSFTGAHLVIEAWVTRRVAAQEAPGGLIRSVAHAADSGDE